MLMFMPGTLVRTQYFILQWEELLKKEIRQFYTESTTVHEANDEIQ